MTYKELGRIFAATRSARNLTQAYVAEYAGVSDRTILNIEHGYTTSSLKTLCRVCRALDLPETLVTRTLLPELTAQVPDTPGHTSGLPHYELTDTLCFGEHSFGIALVTESDGVVIRQESYLDLSTDVVAVSRFVAQCNDTGLDPIQLFDVVNDFLNRA